MRTGLRVLLAVIMVLAGVAHFTVMKDAYVAIMPQYLPAHLELVYLTGVLEILGGVGLLPAKTRNLAGWGLVALFVAMLPANINQLMHDIQPPGLEMSPGMLKARIPMQLIFILWAWWVSRPDRRA